MPKHCIHVSGIHVYAYHGCMEEESLIGGKFIVDLEVTANLDKAIQSDNLHETVDYVRLTEVVKREMATRSKLIEHAAGRIIDAIKKQFPVEQVKVTVKKLNPPVEAEVKQVAVTLEG